MARGSHPAPFLLAFELVERHMSSAVKSGPDGYPPYNIERIRAVGDASARLRVTLAVAGFRADQIEIVQEGGQLVIRGRQRDDRDRIHYHRGIAARQFQRIFLLAEEMRIAGATIAHGLLFVELAPPQRTDRDALETASER